MNQTASDGDVTGRSHTIEDSDYPPLHHAANALSQTGQRAHVRLIAAELLLGIAAALAMDMIHPFPDARVWLATIAMLSLAIVLLVQALKLRRRLAHDQDWFEGRAVAESIKTLTWRYMMRVEPFDDDTQADQNLAVKLEDVLGGNPAIRPTLVRQARQGPAITARMRATRSQAWQSRRDLYLKARLEDQSNWYLSRSSYNAKWAGRMLWLSLGSQVSAIVLAIDVLVRSPELNVVPFFTTLAASAVGWSQAKRFDELRKSYREAHDELDQIRDSRALSARSEADFVVAVREAEAAISREHTMWVAKSGVVDRLPSQATSRPVFEPTRSESR